jgi:hypothetical protein
MAAFRVSGQVTLSSLTTFLVCVFQTRWRWLPDKLLDYGRHFMSQLHQLLATGVEAG